MKRTVTCILLLSVSMLMWGQNTVDTYAFKRGVEAWRQQDMQTAYQYLSAELKEHPTNGYAYAALAFMCHDAKAPNAMVRSAYNALKYLPKNDTRFLPDVCRLLSQFYLQACDTLAAENCLRQAMKVAPENLRIISDLADLYRDTGQYDKMLTLGKAAKAINVKDYHGYLILYDAYRGLKQYQEAIDEVNIVILLETMKPERNERLLDFMHIYRTNVFTVLGRYKEALEEGIPVINNRVNPTLIDNFMTIADSIGYELVIEALKQGEQNGKVKSAWSIIRAEIYSNHHRYVDAYIELHKAMLIQESADIWRRMSSIAMNYLSDAELAETCLRNAVRVDSTSAFYYTLLADYYHDLNRYDDALQAASKAVSLDPSYDEVYYIRSRIYRDMHDTEHAITDFYSALVANPDYLDAYFGIAQLYGIACDTASMRVMLDKGVEARARANDSIRAEDYILLGNYELAYQRAKERIMKQNKESGVEEYKPNLHPGTYYNAACTFARIGRTDEALDALRRAFEAGFANFYHIAWDDDLDNLRALPEFDELISTYKQQAEQRKQRLHDILQTF